MIFTSVPACFFSPEVCDSDIPDIPYLKDGFDCTVDTSTNKTEPVSSEYYDWLVVISAGCP